MSMKKSRPKNKSSAKAVKVSAKKITGTSPISALKTAKKPSSAKTEKKIGGKGKATVPGTKAPAKKKTTSVSPVKTSGKKNVTSKTTKTVKKSEVKKPLKAVKGTKAKPSGPKTKAKSVATQSTTKTKKLPNSRPDGAAKAPKVIKTVTGKVPVKKPEKTSVKVSKDRKTPEKKPAKAINNSKSVIPGEKPGEKSLVKTVVVKTTTIKKKTFKPLSTKKPAARKIKEAVAKKKEVKTVKGIKVPAKTKITAKGKKSSIKTLKTEKAKITPKKTIGLVSTKKPSAKKIRKVVTTETGVKTIKGVKTAAKAESTTKGVKTAVKTLKVTPKKKSSIGKTIPQIKETVKQKTALKPKEKEETPVAPARKTVKKKGASSLITTEPLPAISEKTTATYTTPPQAETKPEKSAKLKIFLPEEEFLPEEAQRAPSPKLPEEYGENELLLMGVDPSIVFVSWEIKPDDISGETGKLTLRVYDVTGIDFDGSHANRFFDISLRNRVDSKFIDIKMHGKDVIMEVGLLHPEGTFKAIKQSKRVSMPALQTFEELGITGALSEPDTFIGY